MIQRLLLGSSLVVLGACQDEQIASSSTQPQTDRVTVAVVNYPLKYIAEQVGDDDVEVVFPAPADGDPAFWSPDAEAVGEYQAASLVLLNGAGYAAWTSKATLPESRLVDTSAAFADRLVALDDLVTHSHGPEGDHSHAGTAFTTWLDPTLAAEHARAVRDALTERRPDRKETFRQRCQVLEDRLDSLDQLLAAAVAADPGRPLIGSHPVYQYLARRYEMNLRSVHWEPDEMPTEDMWRDLGELLKTHPARWMMWEGEPAPEVVERLATMGIGSFVFEPCGNVPADGDYLEVQERNAGNLAAAYSRDPS